jgi:hypothetical protein
MLNEVLSNTPWEIANAEYRTSGLFWARNEALATGKGRLHTLICMAE